MKNCDFLKRHLKERSVVQKCLLVLIAVSLTSLYNCEQPDPFSLEKVLQRDTGIIARVIDSLDKFEVQILYTQIDRDENNLPKLKSFEFNVNESKYFYPASTVKMPVGFLALQRLNEIREDINVDVDRNTPLFIGSSHPPQTQAIVDSTTVNNVPTIARYIEKIFSISDNDAYNRLYEFLGQDYINDELQQKGIFSNSRIRTRVGISGFNTESNKYTNPYALLGQNKDTLYSQEEYYALRDHFQELEDCHKGVGYFDDSLGTVVKTPFDMCSKNFINIRDLEASLMRVIMPELFDEKERYNLTEDQLKFLYSTMQRLPRQFDFLKKDSAKYYDSYVKFLMFGDSEEDMPQNVKVFNKVGWAYGYLTDCAYIMDTKNKVEFFLTAVIHVNANGIFNDGHYEYESIGLPFLAALGKALYRVELDREKKYYPHFQRFGSTDSF